MFRLQFHRYLWSQPFAPNLQCVTGNGFSGVRHFATNKNSPKIHAYEKRQLWFVFPGLGTQWPGMGKDLMKIAPFRDSVQKSITTLNSCGVDLPKLLAPGNESIFKNIRDAIITIVVTQIALCDALIAVGIGTRVKGFFGHSFGEILCAYCNGSITAEEAILIADAQGKAILETYDEDCPGAMAAVYASWEQVIARCPPQVHAACHNGPKIVTVSGNRTAIQKFIASLGSGSNQILGVEINSCGIAAHSPAMDSAKEVYLKYMEKIFGKNVERFRNDKWIPTSFPKKEWDSPLCKTVSPAFYAHNLVNPVFFQNAVMMVPDKAIVVEIAPKPIFSAIMKANVPTSASIFAPMNDGGGDMSSKLNHFLKCVEDIGKAGIHINKDILKKWKTLA